MKTKLRSWSYLLLFLAAVALLLGAAPEAPTAGKFLVLRNGHTLEGDIERVENQYRLRRNGSETWIPANTVLRLFHDTEDAYKFLFAKTPANDPDARLRLAEWCEEVNLRERAIQEALAADRLRPNDAETKRILARLQQPATSPAPPSPKPPIASPQAESAGSPLFDLTPEALGQFTQKVQPILLNACASCHTTGRSGSFKLTKTTEIASQNRKATQENLAAVFGQINQSQPQASPLLTKSVTIHGGSDRAPFKGRQAVPYRVLDEWVRTTLANNPQLQQRQGGIVSAMPSPVLKAPEAKLQFADAKGEPMHPVEPPRPNVVPIVPIAPAAPLPRSAAPSVTAKPPEAGEDAYDPAEFNRLAHPERGQATASKP